MEISARYVEAVNVAWDHPGYEEDGVDDAVHAGACDDHSEGKLVKGWIFNSSFPRLGDDTAIVFGKNRIAEEGCSSRTYTEIGGPKVVSQVACRGGDD